MLSLRPYQETAADFLFEHDRAMVLAPVGAGKTALTLTATRDALRLGLVKRWLVVAPKRVCTDVWPREIEKWAKHLSCTVAVGTAAQRAAAFDAPAKTGANVVIINYDNLQWLADVITAKNTRGATLNDAGFGGVVFDELTKLKNPSGIRFKALASIIKDVRVRWGLTGSFTSNGLEDVFGQCKIIDQSLLGRSKGAFLQQYFLPTFKGTHTEWKPAPNALQRVMERIKPATYVLEPGQYADTLPPLHTVPIELELSDAVMRDYQALRKDFVLQFPNEVVVAQNAAVVTQKLQQIASGFVYTPDPRWLSRHKMDALADLLDENQRAPTLVWYAYKEELAELLRLFPHGVCIDDTGAIERWNTGTVELMFVHPQSAGHGLNLQFGGCHMVWLSLPWSLELYEQAIGRLHRSGQKHDVWNYVMQTKGTVDEVIFKALQDKRTLSDIALEALK